MTNNSPTIYVKAKARHNGVFLIIVACALALFTLLLSQFFWQQYQLVLIFIYLISLVTLITGIAKKSEPRFSFKLTPEYIKFFHRAGHWQLNWQQIKRLALIKETSGLEQIQLPYIGINLVNIEDLVTQITPRLANRLIHEQKPLMSLAVMQGLLTLKQTQLNFEPFTLSSGKVIKGPMAGFLYHCVTLHNAYGYHLFISEGSTDRELDQFCALLKNCMLKANEQT